VGQDREQGLTLRFATAADAAVIADLVRLAFSAQSAPTNPPSSALRETAATITHELSLGGGAVVLEAGSMVGAVLWKEEEGSLYFGRLAVDPTQRRRGIALMLVSECEREARRRGLTRMHLGVRLELDDNRQLFLSCGFHDAEFLSHEGFSVPTWVRMERTLE
jgi:ribosomal protein S18 acetylase RimI-like enzyme